MSDSKNDSKLKWMLINELNKRLRYRVRELVKAHAQVPIMFTTTQHEELFNELIDIDKCLNDLRVTQLVDFVSGQKE